MNYDHSEALDNLWSSLSSDDIKSLDSRATFGLNDKAGLALFERSTPTVNKVEAGELLDVGAKLPHLVSDERVRLDVQLNKLAHSLSGDERFNVNTSIGEGTYGRVWHVIDRDLKRSVAIKTFKGPTNDAQSICEEEVKFVGRLDHPSIPTVYDMGVTDEGQPFLMMELLEGEGLDIIINRLRSGDAFTHQRYSFVKRADIIIQLLRVLVKSHEVDVLHRDIKPENILISSDGHLSLIDWGCAVELCDVKERSQVCGTPLFMAPEQILGTGLSAASDLFSVGAVAYELFCLRPPAPTEGTIHDVLRAVLTHEPDQVDQIHHPAQGYVPSEFYVTIMRALRRKPLERPQSAQEMMIMLQRALDGHIDIVCPRTRIKSTLARFSRWIDRDPYKSVPYFYLTLVFIIALLVAIGVMIGALVF